MTLCDPDNESRFHCLVFPIIVKDSLKHFGFLVCLLSCKVAFSPEAEQTAAYLFWFTHVRLVKTWHTRYDSWGIHLCNVIWFSVDKRFAATEQMCTFPNHLQIQKLKLTYMAGRNLFFN